MTERKTRISSERPYKVKKGKEDKLRLRTAFTIFEPVFRKCPAEPGEIFIRSIAFPTSARNRSPRRGAICRYWASYFFMSCGNSGVVGNRHSSMRWNSASVNPRTLPLSTSSIPRTACAMCSALCRSSATLAIMRRARSRRSVSDSSITAAAISSTLMHHTLLTFQRNRNSVRNRPPFEFRVTSVTRRRTTITGAALISLLT